MWFMNATIKVIRVEYFVVWATYKPGEEFTIYSRHTDDKVFLGQDSIKLVSGYNIWGYRKPEEGMFAKN